MLILVGDRHDSVKREAGACLECLHPGAFAAVAPACNRVVRLSRHAAWDQEYGIVLIED